MNSVRPLPEKDAVKLAGRICDALAYMHEHDVIHRDLKPQNIMICYDGTIRIMDFGIAKAAEGRRITFTGFSPSMGTPDYMAPEQVKGKRGDERTDIYSLGAMLYEMVVGLTPFECGERKPIRDHERPGHRRPGGPAESATRKSRRRSRRSSSTPWNGTPGSAIQRPPP